MRGYKNLQRDLRVVQTWDLYADTGHGVSVTM